MKIKHFVAIITIFTFGSCKQPFYQSTRIEGKQINIKDTLTADPSIEAFVRPFREHINNSLDSVLAYAPNTLSKTDGEYNTAIGNLMADIVMKQVNPVFHKRTGKNIDVVLLNHGGIRAVISKGNITSRTAFEVMPFENSVVVAELNAGQMRDLCKYLSEANRAHPISGMQLTLNNDQSIHQVSVQGQPINDSKSYYVATSDYLVNGGDNMAFFRSPISLTETDYLIRNAMIDYFKKMDTIAPVRDNRFIKLD